MVDDLISQYEDEGQADTKSHDDDGVLEPSLNPLSYEDAKRMLQEKHGEAFAKDDPIWLVFTVFQSFLDLTFDAHKELIKKSNKTLTTEMDGAVEKIKEEMKPLASEVIKSQLHVLFEKTHAEARVIERLYRRLWQLALFVGFCATVTGVSAATVFYHMFR